MKQSIIDLFKSLTSFQTNYYHQDNRKLKTDLLRTFKTKFDANRTNIEVMMVASIDSNNQILSCDLVLSGSEYSIDTTNLSPLYNLILSKSNVEKVVLAHNHPSEICLPSDSDVQFTKDLKNKLKRFQVDLHDHFILTKRHYFSLSDNSLI